jgi:hypothetical protein
MPRAMARAPGAQRAHADRVHGQVHGDHARHAQQQAAREVALRPAHLRGHEGGRLPAAVGEEHGHQRGPQRGEPGRRRRGRAGRRGHRQQAEGHQPADGQQLQDHERVLHAAAPAHAQAVHRGEAEQRRRRHRPFPRPAPGQVQRVAREGHGHRGHSPALHDEQQRPAVEEGGQRPERLAQVGVLPARGGTARGQLRPDEGSGQGHQPAQDPGQEDARGRARPARHHVGVHEDAGPHDAAHDDHGGVEEAEAAAGGAHAPRA